MKTFRASQSVENHNARWETVRHGRAGGARAALFEPDTVLADRRLRRANRLDHAQAARLDVLLRNGDGTLVNPTLSLNVNPHSRMITGFTLTTS